jgi:N-acetylneuraminate lyase
MANLYGILPALVTPVDADRVFQPRPYEQLLERVYSEGVHGVYVCGQTGEGLQLPRAERERATECAVANSPKDKQVIVHIGAATTPEAIALARHAAKAKAHAVSSLPPAGNYSFEEIYQYYQQVAAASDLPFLVYYFPSIAPAIRTTEQVLSLCEIPNVVGLKFTDSDFFRMWALCRSGAVIFNGFDEMAICGLITGANGGIGTTYNLIAPSFVELYKLVTEGRWDDARQVQDTINEFVRVLLRFPLNPAVKMLLKWTGIDCGESVAPRRRLTPQEEIDLRFAVEQTRLGKTLLGA